MQQNKNKTNMKIHPSVRPSKMQQKNKKMKKI